jgi:hypothetical protein
MLGSRAPKNEISAVCGRLEIKAEKQLVPPNVGGLIQ